MEGEQLLNQSITNHNQPRRPTKTKRSGDSSLSPRGLEYARLLPDALEARLPPEPSVSGDCSASLGSGSGLDGGGLPPPRAPVVVWTSTLKRTIATARHLPYPKLRWKALDEIHAGEMGVIWVIWVIWRVGVI